MACGFAHNTAHAGRGLILKKSLIFKNEFHQFSSQAPF
jgi:hypothetical protein